MTDQEIAQAITNDPEWLFLDDHINPLSPECVRQPDRKFFDVFNCDSIICPVHGDRNYYYYFGESCE